jgi:hypothetical protein
MLRVVAEEDRGKRKILKASKNRENDTHASMNKMKNWISLLFNAFRINLGLDDVCSYFIFP